MLMSLDPSTPEDQPMLRTDEQTQTSVGLSAINVRRLRKMREEMQVTTMHTLDFAASCSSTTSKRRVDTLVFTIVPFSLHSIDAV